MTLQEIHQLLEKYEKLKIIALEQKKYSLHHMISKKIYILQYKITLLHEYLKAMNPRVQ